MVDRLVNSEVNARRIATVESCFGSSGVPLAITGRVLVGEGVLTKMCRKRPKARQFFLFNDILVYGNIVLAKKIYNKQHIMPLEEVSLESLEDNGQYQNGWLIRTTTKSFVVYAATAREKQEWMAHINKCVEDLLRKSGKKPVVKHAAVWVPDADASVCMHCKKTQFTIIVRRHHCRNCGAVVCGPCSSKKFLLPQQSTKPVRVCTGCYDRLSKAVKLESSKTALAAVGVGGMGGVEALSGGASGTSSMTSEIPPRANADSSGDDDSDDEGGAGGAEHDEPRFYGDNALSVDFSNISLTTANNNNHITNNNINNSNNNNNTNPNANNNSSNNSANSQLTAGGI